MESKQELLKEKLHKVPNITDIRDLLYKSVESYSKEIAFKVKDDEGKIIDITYEQFKQDVEALGSSLKKLNLIDKPVCVIGKNSYEWSVSYMASSILGVVVPLDKELHEHEIINFIEASEAGTVIGDTKHLEMISKIKKNIKLVKLDEYDKKDDMLTFKDLITQGKENIQSGNNPIYDAKINPDEMHILLFTSGTTNNSKGVCLSHRNIASNVMAVAQIVEVDTSVTVLSILPLHHTYECTLGFLLIIYGGGTITHCEGLRHILKNMEEYKPNFILCVPLLLENVHNRIMKTLKKKFPSKYFDNGKHVLDNLPFFIRPIVKRTIKKSLGGSINTFIVGAAAMNPDIIRSFNKFGMRVLQGYGLTECSPLVAGNNDFYCIPEAAGMPIPHVEYKIDNPGEDGTGEIIVRGPNVMLGYYKDEEETNKVLKDGWFYTGDIGRMDEDGFVYITGRCKSVIVTKNGKNIYPEEIEYSLNNNPYINEALVLGVNYEGKDETYVNAKIIVEYDELKENLGIEKEEKDKIHDIINKAVKEVNDSFPLYKRIRNFEIIDEFEKTSTNKIKRFGKNLEWKI